MNVTITHRPEIRRDNGPITAYRMHCRTCGAHSPWAYSRETAVIAREAHLREVAA